VTPTIANNNDNSLSKVHHSVLLEDAVVNNFSSNFQAEVEVKSPLAEIDSRRFRIPTALGRGRGKDFKIRWSVAAEATSIQKPSVGQAAIKAG
jgi:hypothetical protein